MGNFLLLLSFVSGVCGIAYEVLYARLLSTYFGNIFYISAAILISFLLSIGIGSKLGHRVKKYLPLIEILIGVYAIFAVYAFKKYALLFYSIAQSDTAHFPILLVIAVAIFLIIPAVLIGFCVPIFSLLANSYKNVEFKKVYGFYNIGAAISVLCIEFILIRTFGISSSILIIAFINILNGIVLAVALQKNPIEKISSDLEIKASFIHSLFFISIASGIYQLFFLKILYEIFGPFNENFAILLFVSLASIYFSQFFFKVKKRAYIHIGIFSVLVTSILLTPLIYFIAFIHEHFSNIIALATMAKIVIVFIFALPVYIFFGAAVPFFLHEKSSSGNLLATACFGNVVGYILMTFILYEKVIDPLIPLVIITLLIIALIFYKNLGRKDIIVIVIATASIFFVYIYWPEKILNSGYQNIKSISRLNEIKNNMFAWEEYKKFNSNVSVLHFTDGSKWLSINGNTNLRFGKDKLTWLRETIVGLSPAMYAENHDKALVLGLGSGVTVNAVAHTYGTTKVIEINPAMIDGVKEFKNENMNILENTSVTVILQDGIVELFNSEEKYDTIVNTVTSPKYFSSSKLWTKETFEVISEKLNKGGVYSMWLDTSIGVDGIQILTKTARQVFNECTYIYLNQSYFNIICSNDSLIQQPYVNERISKEMKGRVELIINTNNIEDFIDALRMNFNEKYLYNKNTHINTLDYPILEFISSNINNKESTFKFVNRIMTEAIVIDPVTKKKIPTEMVRTRCLQLYKIDPSSVSFCKH